MSCGNYDYVIRVKQSESGGGESAQDGLYLSPLPGLVLRVEVTPQQIVKDGDVLVVIESMKMEHFIRATGDGVVSALFVDAGDTVKEGSQLASITLATPS